MRGTMLLGQGQASFIFKAAKVFNTLNGDPGFTMSYPTGVAVGDLCVCNFWAGFSAYTSGPAGWTNQDINWGSPYGYHDTVLSKSLVSGDISSPPVITNANTYGGPVMVLLYTNVASIAYRAQHEAGPAATDTNDTHCIIPGFTPGAGSKGLLTFCHDRSGNNGALAGGTGRATGNGLYFSGDAADMKTYNGAAVDWAGASTGTARLAYAFDFL
jgi:hypothetical protein